MMQCGFSGGYADVLAHERACPPPRFQLAHLRNADGNALADAAKADHDVSYNSPRQSHRDSRRQMHPDPEAGKSAENFSSSVWIVC